MKTYRVQSSEEVTQEQIDDVLVTAFEGGITYWCDEVREMKGKEATEETKYHSDVLTRGGILELHDAEENDWLPLTLDQLLKALGDMKFDFDNYDAGDADAVVQQAVFGEVVYG